MAGICFSVYSLSPLPTKLPAAALTSRLSSSSSWGHISSSKLSYPCGCNPSSSRLFVPRESAMVVCMAPDEEKLTRRNPLDFPIEWERPKPGRRPDIFPQFSPMKTPLPPPLPYDPPEEDEEEEEKKEEEEENPDKEEPDKQENQ